MALILILVLFGWLERPAPYAVRSDEIQRFLGSWGRALADGGRITLSEPGTTRAVVFLKKKRKAGGFLVLRIRNQDAVRPHFKSVAAAFSNAGIAFDIERTPTGRDRAIAVSFAVGDALMPSAAAHAARMALTVMGTPEEGPFELLGTGSYRRDYVSGSDEVIPWSRGYSAGYRFGRLLRRLWSR